MYTAHGLPPEHLPRVRASIAGTRRVLRLPPREAITPMWADEELMLGGESYRVLWMPGHSDYHCCLLRTDGLLLAGDHVLPHITPNIGLLPRGRPDPLGDYLASLDAVGGLGARLTLPGHGRPFVDLAGRATELRAHHEARSAQMLSILREQPEEGLCAGALAAPLFEGRLRTGDDWRFAVAETLAHLEHLRAEGLVRSRQSDGLVRYLAV
jgi:glyoxylase-like metal-dependent hydrolase (beta-lactamase superfamily II)